MLAAAIYVIQVLVPLMKIIVYISERKQERELKIFSQFIDQHKGSLIELYTN